MTSKDHKPEVVILCEDIAHERFIRQYLICCGFEDRKIRNFPNLKGRKVKNNNDFVIKHYAPLVKSYRRKNFQNRAIVDSPEIRKWDSIDLAKSSATKLSREICPQGLDSNTLSSLHHACDELRRLLD